MSTKPVLPPPVHDISTPHSSKRTKAINRTIALALIVIAIGIGIMIHWGIQSENVIQLNKNPLPTRTIRQHPTEGGVVFLTADYNKSASVTGTLRYSFVSSTREVFLPVGKEESSKGAHNVELPIPIPKGIQPDTYRIKVRIVYDLNPLKKGIVEEFYSYPVIIDAETEFNQLPVGADVNSATEPVANSIQ